MDNTPERSRARSYAAGEAFARTTMLHPTIRYVPFRFDENTPFQWNPANPLFGFAMNTLSFVAAPFERYIVRAVHMAMPRIQDPDMQAEAEAFLRQEALHARAHRDHIAALTKQHPGLAGISAELERRFDHLLETNALEYHLAYVANLRSHDPRLACGSAAAPSVRSRIADEELCAAIRRDPAMECGAKHRFGLRARDPKRRAAAHSTRMRVAAGTSPDGSLPHKAEMRTSMDDLTDKVCVITGGASGIGRALAHRFAKAGMQDDKYHVSFPLLSGAVLQNLGNRSTLETACPHAALPRPENVDRTAWGQAVSSRTDERAPLTSSFGAQHPLGEDDVIRTT